MYSFRTYAVGKVYILARTTCTLALLGQPTRAPGTLA